MLRSTSRSVRSCQIVSSASPSDPPTTIAR